MNAFHFLRPWWFLALPAGLGLLGFLWQQRRMSRSWQEICDPALLPHLHLGRSQRRAPWPFWLLLVGLVLAVIALAGPTWQQQPQPLLRQESALVILLDLSRSMAAADLKPSRLLRARLKIEDLLRQRREGQSALVVFAGDAFAVTPLTDDYRTIAALLSSLDPEIMPVQGSDPARAMELGAELLQRSGLREGTLLLVTDEDRPELSAKAAQKLKGAGIELAILGVATPEGAPIPLPEGGFYRDRSGEMVLPRLNEEGLRSLAAAGGGDYRRITIDDRDFQALLSGLDRHRLDRVQKESTRSGDTWQEAGIWLLWPLALLVALAFRRGWLLTLLFFVLLAPSPAAAISWPELWERPDQQAIRDFKAGKYQEAGQRFTDPRWKASALYQAGDYDAALKAQPEAQSADDWYNRGNALAQAGQLEEALKAYDQARKLKPEDHDSVANRKVVEAALEEEKKKKKEEQQAGGDKGLQGQQDQQDEKPGQPGDQASASAPQDEKKAGGKAGEKSAKPDNKQEKAEPGKKVSEKGEKSGAEATPAPGKAPAQLEPEEAAAAVREEKVPTTAEERELQEWLQRLPDDPGGLLRRKFLYQYRERGQQRETDRPW